MSRANEKKRRQVYKGEVHGLLPFETRGMDDPVPTIDFSPTGSSDSVYSFERVDVDGKSLSVLSAYQNLYIKVLSHMLIQSHYLLQDFCMSWTTWRTMCAQIMMQPVFEQFKSVVLLCKNLSSRWTI